MRLMPTTFQPSCCITGVLEGWSLLLQQCVDHADRAPGVIMLSASNHHSICMYPHGLACIFGMISLLCVSEGPPPPIHTVSLPVSLPVNLLLLRCPFPFSHRPPSCTQSVALTHALFPASSLCGPASSLVALPRPSAAFPLFCPCLRASVRGCAPFTPYPLSRPLFMAVASPRADALHVLEIERKFRQRMYLMCTAAAAVTTIRRKKARMISRLMMS